MTNTNLKQLFYILTLISIFTLAAAAQTTAFSYQGRLSDAGSPANGSFQMQFKLFDSSGGGGQIGSTITDVPVTATQGVFSARLDFGSNALSGANRWIEIAVRRNSGDSYTTLSPREQIASSPYSVRTLSAASADVALNSNQLGGVNASEYVTNTANSFIRNQAAVQPNSNFNVSGNGFFGGNVGIGTETPQSKLAVFSTPGYGFTHTDGTVTVGSYVSSIVGGTTGWYGTKSNHPLAFFTNNGGAQMTVATNGNVGIGTTTPSTRLALSGGAPWTSAQWAGSLSFQNASAIGWEANASGQRFGIGQTTGGLSFFRTNSAFGNTANPPNYDVTVSDSGNVGIGIVTPSTRLALSGGAPWTSAQWAGSLSMQNSSALGWEANSSGQRFGIGQTTGGLVFFRTNSAFGNTASPSNYDMVISDSGNVGIGTNAPTARLDVRTSNGSIGLRVDNLGQVAAGGLAPNTTNHLCYNNGAGDFALAFCSSAAEYVPTIEGDAGFPETADLVSIAPAVRNPYGDTHGPFAVQKSATACDPNLLGFILKPESGADGRKLNDHYLPLGIYGYFPAKVTLENGSIKRGDAITSSSKAGYGMKATRACKIIGYALEDADQEGRIQVFAHLSEYTAPEIASLRAQIEKLRQEKSTETEALKARLALLEQAMR